MRNGSFALIFVQTSSRSHTDLQQLLYDGHRFAQHFANTINEHPLLIYVAALPFTPTNTSIFKRFYHSGLPKVVCGVDHMWSPELMELQGHSAPVFSVAFSPDGSKIISGSEDNTIRVWDTGFLMIPPIRGHHNWILSVAFSPDGSKIISGSFDRTIRIWDANTGVWILPPLRGHNDCVRAVAFSPDGSKIISGSDDMTVRVWDPYSGIEILPPLRGHDHWVHSIAFSPDGSKIISGSFDKTIRVWHASTGVQMLPPLRGHDEAILSVAFSPNGSNIISRSTDEIIRMWDASTGVALPHPQIAADGTSRPVMDEQMIGTWLPNINTGKYMGALPVGVKFHCGQVCGSAYVGWTVENKLVLVHFPE